MANIIQDALEFLLECKGNGEILSKEAPPSIYMVPSMIRDLSPCSFAPRVVAIGPLHRQDVCLQGFEVQKTAYLHNLLLRLGLVPETTLQGCAEKVIHSMEIIKACYVGSTTYDNLELAKMMVLDACFILEFIMCVRVSLISGTNMLITGSIMNDLLLIENQIPFFVLEIIFECTFVASGLLREGTSLTTYIQELLNCYPLFVGLLVVPRISNPDHILGFLHEYFRPTQPLPPRSESSGKSHTAMELDRAGMNFKPYVDENWVLAMKLELPLPLFPWFPNFMALPPFSWFRQPTLRMPEVRVGDYSESIFRNLVVYEQSSDVKKYVTSYIVALDDLIDTPEDVALLVKSKVLVSVLGSNEEVVNTINNLCKNIMYSKFFYDREWKEIDVYFNSYWPHLIAGLKRKYFNNPWSIIALIAAFLLFGLTITQTIFTIKPA